MSQNYPIVGVAKGPHIKTMRKYNIRYPNMYIYPEFFDDKEFLIHGGPNAYIQYVKLLVKKIREIKIALYPDYTPLTKVEKIANLDVLRLITFIVPIHSLDSDLEIVDQLKENGFRYFYGYSATPGLHDYTLDDFFRRIEPDKAWYLGASGWNDLKVVIRYQFPALDVGGYFMEKRRYFYEADKVKQMFDEIYKYLMQKNSTLFDYIK
ncbi:188aa long conserved hypothetical protein [Acidianus rod-shaped virus 2]|uniref:Uncharacterized protein n=1 Tax=Acidianus rod-shaped virus 2 TaxID=1732175 RepID=A0A0N9NY60_9VIRU|nr:188aa long conserved hypothetical protein [Acidianus rod-shaped virus 2]ALG96901.1 188aa long conserved hypothetical protein [Acidianus rod-shaped virus 2]